MSDLPARLSYYRATELVGALRGRPVRAVTKPGFPNWDRIGRGAILLAEAVEVAPEARVLHLGCGHGALSVVLAELAGRGSVRLVDTSQVALTMAERTLARNGVGNATVWWDAVEPAAGEELFDVVVLETPTGRKLARRWLAQAHAALRPAGRLYLAGPKNEGIQSIITDAKALFGQAATLAYKEHHRVGVAVKLAPAPAPPRWAAEPGIVPGSWYEFDTELLGQPFHLWSLPGVFSYDRLDEGTALLLATAESQLRRTQQVLDIGCGYGVIGLAAARWGVAGVDLLDANLLAVAATGRNAAANGLATVRALPSDATAAVADERYDLVLTNPPFHAGKAVEYDAAGAFIAGARRALRPGGQFLLVANRFIRYEGALSEHFETVETLAETNRFRVLRAE